MDKTGLINRIITATANIDSGRKGFATRGKEQEGRISYEDGIAEAMTAFKEAQISADPQALILAEYTFITQEFQLLEKADKETINSLTRAIKFFDWKARCIPRQYYKFPCQRRNRRFLHDAFLALKAVEGLHYEVVEQAIPHDKDYRVSGFPRDAFHIAFIGHKTRIQNILKSPGIDPIEKALLKQRLANLSIAQTAYVEKQKKALG